MRKLGAWLALAALALQVAWPLLASAQPRAVTLVPLCTVDGVTHYLEVPTGKTPLEGGASHGDHCPLCFVGDRLGLPVHFEPFAVASVRAEALTQATVAIFPKPVRKSQGARAPPVSLVVTSNDHNFGRQSEEAHSDGRLDSGARCSIGFLRLGLLHGRYAVEHARRHRDRGHAA